MEGRVGSAAREGSCPSGGTPYRLFASARDMISPVQESEGGAEPTQHTALRLMEGGRSFLPMTLALRIRRQIPHNLHLSPGILSR
jgi:hypothetical protein